MYLLLTVPVQLGKLVTNWKPAATRSQISWKMLVDHIACAPNNLDMVELPTGKWRCNDS